MKSYNLIIYFLALGATVVGTAESIITGILDMLASDINVSIGLAGQLVTVYSIAYAVGTPIIKSRSKKAVTGSTMYFCYRQYHCYSKP